jgi:Arc/MetJ family transcription regulator
MPTDKKPIGRPRVETKQHTPARQLGRIDDETWAALQAAAATAGKTFVGWAVPILVRAAKRRPTNHNHRHHG